MPETAVLVNRQQYTRKEFTGQLDRYANSTCLCIRNICCFVVENGSSASTIGRSYISRDRRRLCCLFLIF